MRLPDPFALLQDHLPDLSAYEELYKHLHQNPELSFCEQETAQLVADRLSVLDGYAVTPHIGGHGLAAVLRNGGGPVVLLRADMDALPVQEQTGLPYASTKRMQDASGARRPRSAPRWAGRRRTARSHHARRRTGRSGGS